MHENRWIYFLVFQVLLDFQIMNTVCTGQSYEVLTLFVTILLDENFEIAFATTEAINIEFAMIEDINISKTYEKHSRTFLTRTIKYVSVYIFS